jgi:hypothetical protein
VTSYQFTTPNGAFSADPSNGYSVREDASVTHLAFGDSTADHIHMLLSSPSGSGFSYQAFGAWSDNGDLTPAYNASSVQGSVGGLSVGSVTPGGSIPSSGSASFTGFATGFLAGGQQNLTPVEAALTLSVDFGARTATLVSDPFQFVDPGAGFGGQQFGTDLHGTLSYAAAQNDLTGTLTTGNGFYSGPATARFYGPAVNEIGGVFDLVDSNGDGALAGGFGASPTPPPPTIPAPNFTSWSSVVDPASVIATGIGQEVEWRQLGDMQPTWDTPSGLLNAGFTEHIDAQGDVTFAQIVDTNREVTFDTAKGVSIDQASQDPGYLIATGSTDSALAANPYGQGWNYQSFGVWENGPSNPVKGGIGAASVGVTTSGSAIPTSGTATFSGSMALTDQNTFYDASLTVDVDFGARSASLSTGTFKQAGQTSAILTNATIGGTLTYQPGLNNLTGILSGSGQWSSYSGSATARFYGPAAQEIGGTVLLGTGGSQPSYMAGGFGAARPH